MGAVVAGFVVAHTGTDQRGVVLREHLKDTYGAEHTGAPTGNGVRQVSVLKDGFQVCTIDDSKGPDKVTLTLCLPAK